MIDWPIPDERNTDYVLQHSAMILVLPTPDNDDVIIEVGEPANAFPPGNENSVILQSCL